MVRTKVCYVYSDVDYSHLIETTEEFVDKNKYDVSTIFIGGKVPALYDILKKKGRVVHFVEYSGRKQLISVVEKLRKIFKEIKPDIVHTHLVNASLAGLTAAKLCGIKNRIHTRHHSSECYLYYPHAVYYDKYISFLSKKIVAISDSVFKVLTERDGVDERKIKIVWHGFDLENFKADENVTKEVRRLYGLENRFPIVGAISRFVEAKGLQHLIPAFRRIAEKYPQAKLVLANANGAYREKVLTLLHENLDESQYVLIEFEKRVFDLYKTFDVFVHAPTSGDYEAFGQTYIEALAMEIPSVFT
ncbi:MAG: glycosyltransferase, partial [Pyrinomonadaceae bacterium]|nr:glycosyltransferase [Pyrinomonadaceae bacterium]